MSKLTDKIEALMGDTSAYEDNAGHNEAPVDFRITRKAMLGILADVRELERINGDNWEANRKLMARQERGDK